MIVRHVLHVQASLQVIIIDLLYHMVSILPLTLFVFFADICLDQVLFLVALLATSTATILIFALLFEQAFVFDSFCHHAHGLSFCAIDRR